MFTNDPFACFDLDYMRLVAIQCWSSTLQRTSNIDLDIVELACGEACRKYKDLERCVSFQFPPSIEEMCEVIEAWATWQALDLQTSRQGCMIGSDGMYTFIQEMEQVLERLDTHATEARFIL